ncbi:MAG TPA: MBL fold metallo-hydrolase [Gaiellaceae bacterium]|jgi:glyoxylase-like metal-dependent hydrolase (beta-lactamase superfamily II)|nr:MBL fold metallo-hydrolase [Gaiellaceae bacterium]
MESGGWQIELVDTGLVPVAAEYMGPPGTFTKTYQAPVNVVVLRGHGQTVLVDAGSGPLIAIWPGSTSAPPPAGADLLIATHLDWDHCGGFVRGTWPDELEPAFPDRRVLVPREAAADARSSTDDESTAAKVVAALDAAGLIDEYGDATEPAPGVQLRAAPGHRAGHSIVAVGDAFVYAADVFHHPLHVEHPEWDTQFDADPELGLATRLALFAELADRGVPTAVAHMPGFGRIERSGDGFRWAPVE